MEVISLVDMPPADDKVETATSTIETAKPSTTTAATTSTAVAEESLGGPATAISTEIPVLCLMCPHQSGLSTSSLDMLKVVSPTAYHTLFQSPASWQRMDYDFTQDSLRCDACYVEVVQDRKTIFSQLNTNLHILNLIEASSIATSSQVNKQNNRQAPTIVADEEEGEDENIVLKYCIPRTWLTQFKKITTNLQKVENTTGKGKSAIEYAQIFTKTIKKNENDDVIDISNNTSSSNSNNNANTTADTTTTTMTATTNNNSNSSTTDYLDPFINTVLLCEHNLPIINYLNRSVKINTHTWNEIVKLFPLAKEIKINDIYCQYCQENIKINKEKMEENKNIRQCELNYASLQQLYKRKRIFPDTLDNNIKDTSDSDLIEFPSSYYAVDGLWLAYWRKYISSVHCPTPAVLLNRRLRCVHGKAFLPPLLAGIAQGVSPGAHEPNACLVQKLEDEDVGEAYSEQNIGGNGSTYPTAEVVTTEQWEALLEFHSAEARGKHSSDSEVVVLDADPSCEESSADVVQNTDLFTCQLTRNAAANIPWQWVPEVCYECLSAQEERLTEAVTQYSNARISVVFLREDSEYAVVFHKPLPGADGLPSESPTAPTVPNATAATTTTATSCSPSNEAPRRTSRRTRGKRLNGHIIADSSDELGIIRLKVYEAFSTVDLPPNEQKLYDSRGFPLLNNTKTLSESGFKAVDTLYVMRSSGGVQAGEDWSYLDCFHSTTGGGMEQGFTGTLLQGAGNTSSSSAIAATVSNQTNTEQSSTTTQQQASIPMELSNTNIPSVTSQQQQEASPHTQDSRNKRNPARRKQQSQQSVNVLNTPEVSIPNNSMNIHVVSILYLC